MNRKYIFLSSVFDKETLQSRTVFRNEINARLNFITGRLGENIYRILFFSQRFLQLSQYHATGYKPFKGIGIYIFFYGVLTRC